MNTVENLKSPKSKISENKESGSKRSTEGKEEVKLELSAEDLAAIETRIRLNEPFIEKSLQEIPVNVKGVYISVVVSFIFIILASSINKVEGISSMGKMARNIYEESPWDYASSKYFADLSSLDDIDQYITQVVIPSSYGNLGDYNYLVGFRISLKIAKLVQQPIPDYRDAVNFIKDDADIKTNANSNGEYTDRIGIWKYSNKANRNKGGYALYFLANQTMQNALMTWREAKSIWISHMTFSTLAIEYIFHNPNYACTLYYQQEIRMIGAGLLQMESDLIGSFIEKFEDLQGEALTILILFILYSLGFTLQIFKLAQNLMRTCTTLLVKKKLDLVWHEYIEIMSVVLALVSLIMFGLNVLTNIGKFKLPILTEENFTGLINYIQNFRMFIQITAVAALLISFKVIVVLRYKFPSFGVLFDTILGAKADIINFMVITVFLLVGFAFMGNLAFGHSTLEFSTTVKAFSKLFDMALGQEDIYDDMSVANTTIAPIFLVVYLTIFFLVLTNMFLAIVMSTYGDLKKKGQLILEAKAEMIAEQSKEWFQTLSNLILFRGANTENNALMYEELNKADQEGLDDEEKANQQEQIKMHETLILASTKVDLIKIFKTNFGKLSTLNRPILMTHEQNIEKIGSTLRKILERAKLKKLEKAQQENLVDYNFHLIVQMLIYLVYIVIFIVMILMRLRITDSYAVHQLINQNFAEATFGDGITFEQISTQQEVFQYLEEIFLPTITKESLFDQNYFIDKKRARITLNQYVLYENKQSFSKDVIDSYVPQGNLRHSTSDFRGEQSQLLYLYTAPGTKFSYQENGGYIKFLKTGEDMVKIISILKMDNILGKKGSSMAIEWVTYNANFNLFTYSYITFTHSLSGQIVHELYTLPIELDFFKDAVPIRGILEIIYFLFTMYYIIMESREWWAIWVAIRNDERNRRKGSEALARVIVKLLGKRAAEKGCGRIFETAFKGIKQGLFWLFKFLINVIQSLKRYLQQDVFNVIDFISISLSIVFLSKILMLFMNNFVKNFTVETSSDYEFIGEFSSINSILTSYRILVSFSCLIIFIRLLQFYKFSKRLSLLTDILDSATLDLVFFMTMFSIILFAYTLMSYLLLGHTLEGYSSLLRALVSCYLLLLGEYKSPEIYSADPIFGTIFLVTFIVIFSLIMLNMFIAIIGSHFEIVTGGEAEEEEEEINSSDEEDDGKDEQKENMEIEPKEEDNEPGFFGMILRIIIAKRKGQKYIRNPPLEINPFAQKTDTLKSEILLTEKDMKDEIFLVDQVQTDVNHSSYWMKTLEQVLYEKSDKKIELFKMKSTSSNNEKKSKINKPAKLAEICYMNVEIWQNEPLVERIKLWRSLAILSRESAMREIEKAYIEGSEIPESIRLDDTMKNLWEANTMEEKIELWVGSIHFEHIERVAVWNCLKLDPETFDMREEVRESLSFTEKLEKISNIVEQHKDVIKKIKKSSDKVQTILKLTEKFTDFKLMLWLGLTYNEYWLKCLYVNQPNAAEAEIIGLLNLSLYRNNIFALDGVDYGIEEILDGVIYDWAEAKANYLCEKSKVSYIENNMSDLRIEINSLLNYKQYIIKEIETYTRTKNQLLEELAINHK